MDHGMDHGMDMHESMHHDHASMMMMDMADIGGDSSSASSHLLCNSSEDMGMIMYMDGFRWTLKGDGSCLNFLFPGWTLDTIPKFVAAMLCVIAMGVLTERINQLKHSVAEQAQSNPKYKLPHTCLQGLGIFSAYLLMLVVMTYSYELGLCVILGLMLGHYVFDGDLFHGGDGTPCCSVLERGSSSEQVDETTPLHEGLLTNGSSHSNGSRAARLPTTTRRRSSVLPGETVTFTSCCNDEGGDSQTNV